MSFLLVSIFLLSVGNAKETKTAQLASHDELHKLVETGMPVGVEYKVYTYLSPTGRRLVAPLEFDKEYNKGVRIEHELMPGTEEIKRLYDLRGKAGCFTVVMVKKQVWLKRFSEGQCGP